MKYTHTYKNKKGRDVLCLIKHPQDGNGNVIVKNENGVHVYLPYKNLTKI